ncbi:MAG: ROK family glucokinase [Lachnospiraceae bacterium]|nr:ROK family glucokinase [Lachnospiraceae bacterium]
MSKKCIGVDVGGTTVKLGLFDVDGTVLDKWEVVTRKEDGGKNIIPDIAASIIAKLEEKNIDKADVVGAGMGVPGPVMDNGFVEKCVNLGWVKVNPADELSGLLGVPVKVGNDANVAALGEMWQGGGKGYTSLAAITLGTGVGAGIILDEKIVNGSKGMGGEVGHITVNADEQDKCNCGNRGCLEQYASATGIVKEAVRALAKSDKASVLRDIEGFSCKDVLDAAKAGDEVAASVVDHCMKYLASVMQQVSYICDPQIFVIGGGVSKAGQYLIDVIRKHYNSIAILKEEKADIALATLGNDAGIYGAARLILG